MIELPSIAIVTPCFNHAEFIEQTMLSVLDQNYPKLEYVVMDGGSWDGSVDIIRRHESRLTEWVTDKDGGQYEAIEDGFGRTKGEILGWLNSDDLHMPWTLSVVGEIFAQLPEIEWLTTTRPLIVDQRGRAIHCPAIDGFSATAFLEGEHLPEEGHFSLGFIQQEATFWRRTLFDRFYGFDPNYGLAGDFALWARFFSRGAKLFGVEVPLAAFRVHKEQKTTLFDNYPIEARLILADYSGKRGGKVRRIVREVARRAPAVLRPALASAGCLHSACVVTHPPRGRSWVVEERFI